jgi:DNA mismatch endonuclease (patch repair protein)
MHRRGMRYRLHPANLPGRPDIVLSSAKLAIFVDGCFWHACPDHGSLPKNNRDWWRAKLLRNVERDREKDAALERLGWAVVHIWEHDGLEASADVVESSWRTRRAAAERLRDPPVIL